MLVTVNAWSQAPVNRPGDERPALPEFKSPTKEPGHVLPPIPLPRSPNTESLAAEQKVFIRVIYFSGNTAITDSELLKITTPYSGREVTFSELAELRDKITRVYIERGYLNSGAVVPRQKIEDGVLEIRVIEGRLTDIEIETDGRFRKNYLVGRVREAAQDPLNVRALEERLQLLQQDDRIRNIRALLLPGEIRGESHLKLEVAENKPVTVRFQADNYEHPSVGSEGGRVFLENNNLTGYGDRLSGNYSRTEGSWSAGAYYVLPVNVYDTTLELSASSSQNNVLEEPVPDVESENDYKSYGLTVRQPIKSTLKTAIEIFLSAESRRSETRFIIPNSPADNNFVSKVRVLRFGQGLTRRGRQSALAVRSMFSFGLDILGATSRSGDIPDGRFAAWLGQAQWIHRLHPLNATYILRAELQLTRNPLLGMEQFAIGGHASVRGYRENTLVRDNGALASVDVRIPAWSKPGKISRLDIGVFYDAGRGWNERSPDFSDTLTSIGLGLYGQISRHLSFELEWGYSLNNTIQSSDKDLQDDGIQFQLATEF